MPLTVTDNKRHWRRYMRRIRTARALHLCRHDHAESARVARQAVKTVFAQWSHAAGCSNPNLFAPSVDF